MEVEGPDDLLPGMRQPLLTTDRFSGIFGPLMSSKIVKKISTAGAIAIIVCVGAGVAWNNGVRNKVFPKKFGVVEQGKLYRSGQIDKGLIDEVLERNKIGVVIYMAPDESHRADVVAEIDACKRRGVERINLPLNGKGVGDAMMYPRALAAIKKAEGEGKPVLVHCAAGAQRTGGVTALYRLFVQNKPMPEVMKELYSYGHDPDGNPELIPFLNEHMNEIADGLVELKVIDRKPEPLPLLNKPNFECRILNAEKMRGNASSPFSELSIQHSEFLPRFSCPHSRYRRPLRSISFPSSAPSSASSTRPAWRSSRRRW
jgi:protein tyrosine/serine phosphatase